MATPDNPTPAKTESKKVMSMTLSDFMDLVKEQDLNSTALTELINQVDLKREEKDPKTTPM